MDIEHLISIFILSSEPDMPSLTCCLPHMAGIRAKSPRKQSFLSSQKISLPCLEGSLNFLFCFVSSSSAALSIALFLGKERSCCPSTTTGRMCSLHGARGSLRFAACVALVSRCLGGGGQELPSLAYQGLGTPPVLEIAFLRSIWRLVCAAGGRINHEHHHWHV